MEEKSSTTACPLMCNLGSERADGQSRNPCQITKLESCTKPAHSAMNFVNTRNGLHMIQMNTILNFVVSMANLEV